MTLLDKLVRYFLTAGFAAMIDVGGFVMLATWQMPLLVAATCSFSAAAAVNYTLSSRFVFRAQPTVRRFAVFIAAALIGLTINVGVSYLAVIKLDLSPASAKLAGVGSAFLINFAFNLTLVFRS